ncbi:MAG: nucleoside hydrolase [Trueperaceae bacterium]
MPAPIWLDCDPGHDDVLAIFVAAHASELVGVSAVSGNAALKYTLRNALLACQLAQVSAPVHAGAARPLTRPARHAAHIHGADGLGGPALPELRRQADAEPAVRALLKAAEQREDLNLVAVGPLTNVALALALEPGLATRLKSISIMGGATTVGNVTATAEFNIWADPEAAAMVFESGANIIMAGLDLTHQFLIGRPQVEEVRALGGTVARFAADLLSFFIDAYEESYGDAAGPLHDPCSVLAVTHPHLFEAERRHVAVEQYGELTRGMTVVDGRSGSMPKPPNTQVLTRINASAAYGVLLEALGGLP